MSQQTRSSYYGNISTKTVAAAAVGLHKLPPGPQVQQIQWQVPNRLADMGLPRQSLEFIGVSDHNGLQRILPVSSGELLNYAIPIGTEIIREVRSLGAEEVFSLRASVLAYRWLCSRGAKLRRGFSSVDDLRLRRPELADDHRGDLLPHDLGLDHLGRGRKWTIRQLTENGRQSAVADGVARPRKAEVIAHGLSAAALLNPLVSEPERSNSLIRIALFAAPEPCEVDDAVRGEVAARLCQAMESHASDSLLKFENWYLGPHSNLPKSLANRKTETCGKLPIPVVNRVLQDFGWDGHRTVAKCLHATMRWVENCLGDHTFPVDRDWFEDVYFPQPKYGDLSLLMLLDRAPLIKPMILRLWESPDDATLIGAFHRLLHYYQQMVDTRRSADQRSKRLQQSQRKSPTAGYSSRIRVSNATSEIDIREATSRLLVVANDHAAARDICCPKCGGNLNFKVADMARNDDQMIECIGTCVSCSKIRTIEIPWENAISALTNLSRIREKPSTKRRKRPR